MTESEAAMTAYERRTEREEAFMHGLGLTLVILVLVLIGVFIYAMPWFVTALVASFLVLPLGNLARTVWRQRKQA